MTERMKALMSRKTDGLIQMKKGILALLMIIFIIIISVVGCSNNSKSTTSIVGNWIYENYNSKIVPRMGNVLCLYEGGTGKGYETEKSYSDSGMSYSLTYEIKGETINIKNTGFPNDSGIKGFKLKDDKLVSLDGEDSYIRYSK